MDYALEEGPWAFDGDVLLLKELDIHLQAVPRLGLLVAFPPFLMRLVLLIGRQPVHAVLDQEPMHR